MKKTAKLGQLVSIIIPTLNEAKYLPKLLKSIKKQTYKNYEVIVADANSDDRTRAIAKKYGCKVVDGGSPGVGRNNGAKVAKGYMLLFLDSDTTISEDFLMYALVELKQRKIDVAGTYLNNMNGNKADKVYMDIFNSCVFTSQYFYPAAYGGCMFCKKWLHNEINGFDKTIKLGEDIDYVGRAGKCGKFRILKKVKIGFSMRRFEMEGRLKVGGRHVLSASYRILFGQIRSNIFKYKMDYKK